MQIYNILFRFTLISKNNVFVWLCRLVYNQEMI